MITHTILTVLPQLWFLVALGFIGARYLRIPLETVTRLTLYLIAPIASFGAVANLDFHVTTLGLPLVGALLSCMVTTFAVITSRRAYADNHHNLISMTATTGNTGYFGVPIVLALFGPDILGLYFLTTVGVVFCEVTVGYYLGSRGHHTVGEALKRVVKLPIIYGMIAGIIYSATGYDLPAPIHAMWQNFLGAFSILGMMIVGLALGHIKHFTWDSKLYAWLLGVKSIVWPVMATVLLMVGVGAFLATFDPRMPLLFVLIAAVPLAGNTPAYAALTGLPTDKAAIATLLSTLLSIVTIPVTLALVNLVYPLGY